jgi:hypothetical protein
VRIVDVLGSSEAGRQAVAGDGSGFRPEGGTVVLSADRTRVLAPGDGEVGWLAQAGRVPLGYLGDPAKTAETFPRSGACATRWPATGCGCGPTGRSSCWAATRPPSTPAARRSSPRRSSRR